MANEQQQQQSMMPLQGEMQLVNYLNSLFGGKQLNPAYTGSTVQQPSLVPEMTGEDMSSVMTEWLRGQGNFLGNQRQQNLAGLYNTSTSKLVANDLTAQAALKAALANTQIKQGNAQLQNQYYSRLQNQPAQYLPQDPNQMGKVGAALGVSALNSLLGGGGKDGGSLLDKITGLFKGNQAQTQIGGAKKPAAKKPTMQDPTAAASGASAAGSEWAGAVDPIEAALNSYYGESDPFISQLTTDALNPNYFSDLQTQLLGEFADPGYGLTSNFSQLADPTQSFLGGDPWSSLPAADFAPIDVGAGFNPSDFSYLTGGNDGADFGFDGTFDGGSDITFTDYQPFVPDTYDSFNQSYGTSPGYDYVDYSDYSFDW